MKLTYFLASFIPTHFPIFQNMIHIELPHGTTPPNAEGNGSNFWLSQDPTCHDTKNFFKIENWSIIEFHFMNLINIVMFLLDIFQTLKFVLLDCF